MGAGKSTLVRDLADQEKAVLLVQVNKPGLTELSEGHASSDDQDIGRHVSRRMLEAREMGHSRKVQHRLLLHGNRQRLGTYSAAYRKPGM